MAAMATSTITGLGSSLSLSRPSSKAFLTSRRSSRRNVVTCNFPSNWLRRDLNVIGFGLIGWLAPSSIPAINGNSLSGLFFSSIGEELAHFPTGPALTSPFWLWLVTWHLGLFISLTFGQIGFKGRTEGYFDK
ncbi:photosystem I subunit O [Carex rostrata]